MKKGLYLEKETYNGSWIDGKWVNGKPNGRYEVALPHSCDQWTIALGKPKAVIRELENFKQEIDDIIEKLQKLANL